MAFAVKYYETGAPDVLRLERVSVGEPGAGEARVRHVAVGINFADTYFRTGYYPAQLPSGIGMEASGVVEAVTKFCKDYGWQFEFLTVESHAHFSYCLKRL